MPIMCEEKKTIFGCTSIFSSKLVTGYQNSCIRPPILWVWALLYATLTLGGSQSVLYFSLHISQHYLTTLTLLHVCSVLWKLKPFHFYGLRLAAFLLIMVCLWKKNKYGWVKINSFLLYFLSTLPNSPFIVF